MGVVAAGVGLAGIQAVGPIALGAGLGWMMQVVSFWLLAGLLFPGRLLPVYSIGIFGRFMLLAVAAFVLVPATQVPAAPTLFALAGVLFATTVLEPVLLATGSSSQRTTD